MREGDEDWDFGAGAVAGLADDLLAEVPGAEPQPSELHSPGIGGEYELETGTVVDLVQDGIGDLVHTDPLGDVVDGLDDGLGDEADDDGDPDDDLDDVDVPFGIDLDDLHIPGLS